MGWDVPDELCVPGVHQVLKNEPWKFPTGFLPDPKPLVLLLPRCWLSLSTSNTSGEPGLGKPWLQSSLFLRSGFLAG